MKLKLNHYVTKALNARDDLCLYNWKDSLSAVVSEKDHPVYQLSTDDNLLDGSGSAKWSKQQLDDVEWLKDNKFLSPDSSVIINSLETAENKELSLILLPAGEACNLNCIYCYEDHSYAKRMTTETAEVLFEFIKKYNPSRVSVEYFGGEPMLNLKFIEVFYDKLVLLGIPFKCSITTNGTLLNSSTLERLYNSGVRSFQITLDGAKELHNRLRVSNSKNLDSFESVCNALRLLSGSCYEDISCMVRFNVNEHTVQPENFEPFFNVFKDLVSASDRRFLILPRPIGDYLSANLKDNVIASDVYCNKTRVSSVVGFVEDRFSEAGYLLADPLILTKESGYACYAGNKNSFVLNPDLKLLKCTVALDDPINDVGYLKLNGDIVLNDNHDLWVANYADAGCMSCFAFTTCTGNSCPLANIKKGSKVCPPFKHEVERTTVKIIEFYEVLSDE